jgi:uncharacterized protein (DUF58 family)
MQISKKDILNTGNLELLAKRAVEGFITGLHKSPFHGFSVEFAEHRQYNQGETTKNIDWKLYGRTDKLYNKQFDEETNLRCQFLIDVSSSMQVDRDKELSKLQYSAWCTAVLLQILKKQRDASGLCSFDNQVVHYSRIASSGRHYKELSFSLNELLNYKSEQNTTDISATLHSIASQIHRRSMVVLFTDFFEPGRDLDSLFEAIKHLKHKKNEVIVFHTLHRPEEIEFEFGNTPMTFEDAETGEAIKLLPSEVKEYYTNEMQQYLVDLKSKFNQYKIDYIIADTSESIEKAIIPFLLKRRSISR